MFKEFAENKNAKLPSSQYRGWAIWRTGTILLGAYNNTIPQQKNIDSYESIFFVLIIFI